MEFEFNWPGSFWENYVLIYYNMSNLGWKVNIELWNLFIAIVLLGLTYEGHLESS